MIWVHVWVVDDEPLVWASWHASLVVLSSSADHQDERVGETDSNEEVGPVFGSVLLLQDLHVLESPSLWAGHVSLGSNTEPWVFSYILLEPMT